MQLSQVGTSLWSLDTSQLNSIQFDPKELCSTNSIQAFDIIIQLIGTSKLVIIQDRVPRLQCLICLHLIIPQCSPRITIWPAIKTVVFVWTGKVPFSWQWNSHKLLDILQYITPWLQSQRRWGSFTAQPRSIRHFGYLLIFYWHKSVLWKKERTS